MKALLVLLLASVCAAQTTATVSTEPLCKFYVPGEAHLRNVPDCRPLKCPKYEHVEPDHFVRDPSVHGLIEGIRIDYTPRCAPDMHEVTEKEWQALMARLKMLEKRQQIDGWPAAGKE